MKSPSAGAVTYVVVRSGESGLGRWWTETRNVTDDYRRIYGDESPATIKVVSIAIDSNDTRSTAESYVVLPSPSVSLTLVDSALIPPKPSRRRCSSTIMAACARTSIGPRRRNPRARRSARGQGGVGRGSGLMAKWEGKHDAAALADNLRRRLGASPNVPRGALGEKRMFGGVCFLLRSNMLCGAGKNGYMFRTDPERAAEAAALPGGAPVIMQGRTMKGFYWVDPGACGAKGLGRWLALAQDYVGAMPPKAGKKRSR